MTDAHEVEVPAYLLDTLRAREAAVAKRCARLNLPAPVVTVTRQWIQPRLDLETGRRWAVPMMAYVVTGERPRLAGGWQVVAVVEHHDTGNIVSTDPRATADAPTGLLNAPSTCDHCQQQRARRHTVVIRDNTGKQYRVGKSCLRDFTGHDLPAVWETFSDNLTDWTDAQRAGGDEHRRAVDVVAQAVAVISRYGWAPASVSDEGGTSTRARVEAALTAQPHQPDFVAVTNDDYLAAVEALEWIATTTDADGYLANLRSAILADATSQHLGLIASLPRAYARHRQNLARAEARAEARQQQRTAPCPTGRVAIAGIVVSVDVKDTPYGSRHVMTVRDDNGFVVWGSQPSKVTRAVGDEHDGQILPCYLEVGDRVEFTATLEPSDSDECFGFYSRPTKAVARAFAKAAV